MERFIVPLLKLLNRKSPPSFEPNLQDMIEEITSSKIPDCPIHELIVYDTLRKFIPFFTLKIIIYYLQ